MVSDLFGIFNWSGYLLISSVIMVFASLLSLSAARRCAHRNHKLLRMRGGECAETSNARSDKTISDDNHQNDSKSKRSLMKYASVVVLKDARMVDNDNNANSVEKSFECYF